MPSTEDRINARDKAQAERERVRVGNRDYSNPFVHLREIVVDETKALAKIGPMIGILGTAKDREEIKARASVLKMVMDRFPEIDWGGPVSAAQTGDITMVPPPIGFKESCDCPACSEYHTFRDRTVN